MRRSLEETPETKYYVSNAEASTPLGVLARVACTRHEVEEYFDGDATMLEAIGGRDLQRPHTNHVGDFNAIIDFPPAPKLDVLNRLVPALSTESELRGEALFNGKAVD